MKKLNKIRLLMVGLLCAGLLFFGIGFGVGFGELSQFTYAGSKPLSNSTLKNFSCDIDLYNQNSKVYINTQAFNNQSEIEECVVTNENIMPGTVHIEASYRSVASVPVIRHHQHVSLNTAKEEVLYLDRYGSPVALFFSYKDELLSDIQNHRLGDYQEFEFLSLEITVNPVDKDRIIFEG